MRVVKWLKCKLGFHNWKQHPMPERTLRNLALFLEIEYEGLRQIRSAQYMFRCTRCPKTRWSNRMERAFRGKIIQEMGL